jgi:hypothetical protein
MKSEPVDGKCWRCKQRRHLFRYVPLHNCLDSYGLMSLCEAAGVIGEMEDSGDQWCLHRLGLRPKELVCTSCFQAETREEQKFIDEVLED